MPHLGKGKRCAETLPGVVAAAAAWLMRGMGVDQERWAAGSEKPRTVVAWSSFLSASVP